VPRLPEWMVPVRARPPFFEAHGRYALVVTPPYAKLKLMFVFRQALGISRRATRWLVREHGPIVSGTEVEMYELKRRLSEAGISSSIVTLFDADTLDLADLILNDVDAA
jgi:hypothetical protein